MTRTRPYSPAHQGCVYLPSKVRDMLPGPQTRQGRIFTWSTSAKRATEHMSFMTSRGLGSMSRSVDGMGEALHAGHQWPEGTVLATSPEGGTVVEISWVAEHGGLLSVVVRVGEVRHQGDGWVFHASEQP